TSNLITPDPVKRLLLNIGMLLILHKKMLGCIFKGVASVCYRICFLLFLRKASSEFKIPWCQHCGRIVLDMGYISTPFQHQRLQSPVAKLLGSPSTNEP